MKQWWKKGYVMRSDLPFPSLSCLLLYNGFNDCKKMWGLPWVQIFFLYNQNVCGILMLLCDCIHTIFVSIILRCCSFGSHDASLCCIFLRTWMLHSLTIHYSTLFVFLNLPTFSSNVVVFHLVSWRHFPNIACLRK
jgi:hypothetical protein